MNDMILNVLNTFEDIAQDSCVIWDLNSQGIFDSSHGAECMYGRSDTTDALRKRPSLPRITSFQDRFNASEHRAGCPRICHEAIFYLDFYPQMSFDAGDWINYDSFTHDSFPFSR